MAQMKIPSVDKIVGPGNIYVAAAKKKLVFWKKSIIDMIAGPKRKSWSLRIKKC